VKSTILALFSRFQGDFAFLPKGALVLITSSNSSSEKMQNHLEIAKTVPILSISQMSGNRYETYMGND
jgi:hypothetical protein